MTNCPDCEYHKDRAARWRAEAYKQAGHDVIELPWVGLTDEEIERVCVPLGAAMLSFTEVAQAIEAKLKEKNS